MLLGAGRSRVEDSIDPAVGIMVAAKLGDHIRQGAPLAVLAYNDAKKLEEASRLVEAAYTLQDALARPPELLKSRIA